MEEWEEEEYEEGIEFGVCEECGSEYVEHKEYVDGDKHFLPQVWIVCPKCDKE